MDESWVISQLIGGIYDAALDPSLWRDVLARASAFVGGVASALYAKDAAAKQGNILHDDGNMEQCYKDLYFARYVKLDPATVGHFFAEIDEPIATADLMPFDEFLQTRFYKEWVKPQRLIDHITVALEKSATSVALFGVFRHERDGPADGETRRRMRLIAPHVRRSVMIGNVIDLKRIEAATFADALDCFNAGLFMVDAAGRVVYANAAGLALLASGDALESTGGRLLAHDPESDRHLHEIIVAAGNGDAALGIRGIAMPLNSRGGEPYVAYVLPLTSGARRRVAATYVAVAALFVHKASLSLPSPPEVIAKTYHLTPTELRVLLAVVEVGGVPEVAEALGVATETVKTHLSRLYLKTGAGRQADLVKLVAGFASPLKQ